MMKMSPVAILFAYLTEFVVDLLIRGFVLFAFASGSLQPDMSDAEQQAVVEKIVAGGGYLTLVVALGTATTVGGGWLAARLAKKFPYYNGLGIGLLGLAMTLFYWRVNPLWLNLFGALSVLPASIYGGHLAKRQADAAAARTKP